MAEGRAQIDGDGCYRVAAEANIADTAAGNDRYSRALLGVRNGKEDIADIAVQQLLNK
jgi:hypothetical protein